jgi:hypothetical protein
MKKSTEDSIVAYVEAHPDQSSTEIAKGLGLSTGTVKPKLKELAIARKISRTLVSNASGIGRQEFRYFPNASKSVQKRLETQAPEMILEPGKVEILLEPRQIAAHPGLGEPYAKQDLDQIISDFAQRIAESVVAQALPLIIPKLRDEMAKVVAEAANCVVERPGPYVTPKPEPKKLPSVFVGGLHGGLNAQLHKEFDGVADIRTCTADDSLGLWKSKAAHADHVFLAADFIGHKHTEAIASTGVVANIVRGGITTMKDKIMKAVVV